MNPPGVLATRWRAVHAAWRAGVDRRVGAVTR